MTHLRKMMLEELERRNYAQTTIDCYLRVVAEFSLHFHRPPNQLGQEHIRQYQAHRFGRRKLAPSTVTQHLAALRFFYIKTLRKPWSIAETPCPKKVQRLPSILSPDEVAQLIRNSNITPMATAPDRTAGRLPSSRCIKSDRRRFCRRYQLLLCGRF
jgi:site-specific recombinase XerD